MPQTSGYSIGHLSQLLENVSRDSTILLSAFVDENDHYPWTERSDVKLYLLHGDKPVGGIVDVRFATTGCGAGGSSRKLGKNFLKLRLSRNLKSQP